MSSSKNRRIVVKNPEGGWDVKAPGAKRSSSHQDTQEKAIERAKEIVANSGGGEVTIQDRNNKFREGITVAPANDPYPPEG